MGYTRESTKAEIIENILVERGEIRFGDLSYFELERHPLMRKKRDELIKLYDEAFDNRPVKRVLDLIKINANKCIAHIEEYGKEDKYTDTVAEYIINLAEELKRKTEGERT